MITVEQAANALHKALPELTIVECKELKNHWVFTAVKDTNEVDYNDPFYAVDKQNGDVTSYFPFADIKNYKNAKPVAMKF